MKLESLLFQKEVEEGLGEGGDHGVAFLRAPTSKGWSCFYSKSLDVDEKVVICTLSNYNHKAPARL